jgi:hypothetical protein
MVIVQKHSDKMFYAMKVLQKNKLMGQNLVSLLVLLEEAKLLRGMGNSLNIGDTQSDVKISLILL